MPYLEIDELSDGNKHEPEETTSVFGVLVYVESLSSVDIQSIKTAVPVRTRATCL